MLVCSVLRTSCYAYYDASKPNSKCEKQLQPFPNSISRSSRPGIYAGLTKPTIRWFRHIFNTVQPRLRGFSLHGLSLHGEKARERASAGFTVETISSWASHQPGINAGPITTFGGKDPEGPLATICSWYELPGFRVEAR